MLLHGQWTGHHLLGVDDREDVGARCPQRQHPVVPSAALSQSPPVPVHAERRNKESLCLVHRLGRQRGTAGFQGASRCPLGEVRRPLEPAPASCQVRSEHRQQYLNAGPMKPFQQQSGAGLGAHRHEGRHRRRAGHRLQGVLGQSLAGRRVPGVGVVVMGAAVRPQHLAQLVLGVVDLESARIGKVQRAGRHGVIFAGEDASCLNRSSRRGTVRVVNLTVT